MPNARLELPFGVKIVNPKPVDAKAYNDEDAIYASTTEVLAQNPLAARYKGQTFLVDDGAGSALEFWFKSDISDLGLVLKSFDNNPDKTYIHTQMSASTTWTVNHDLDKFPNVSIVSSIGEVVYGQITYNNLNQCTLSFSAAFSGKAYCN